MRNEPRNEHEAWATLWATLEPRPADRLTDKAKPPRRHEGPYTYHHPIAPPSTPLRAFLRLAGATLIATLCALIAFS